MTARARFAPSLFAIPILTIFILGVTLPAVAKDDWLSDAAKWAVSSDTNPNCKVRYTVGIYRPDMGDKPAWGVMTEEMFRWFSKDGVKLAPSVCPKSRYSKDKIAYRILFSVSPMKTVSRTTHGSEVQTTTQPFNASINSRATYSDGSTATGTATVNGEQTSTIVVPTETTISQSSVALYMYTYRVNGDQLELIGSDSVVFSRVAASGSGNNAAGAELGAGIGNLIRMSGDRHRPDKLYEEALKAIRADAQDNGVKQDTLPVNHASLPIVAQGAPAVIVPITALATPSAPESSAQTSANTEPAPSAESIATLKEQAASGNADAQSSLADAYAYGKDVPRDYTQAAVWYRKAAEQGDALSQYNLGVLYDSGLGLPQDHAQAAVWYRKAADQGNANARNNLGGLYLEGQGVPQDYAQAAVWYRKAAEQGYAIAQSQLGWLYANGHGVQQDDAQAALWYRKAAGQGDAHSQLMLGLLYAIGHGVPQDNAEAYFWLDLAAADKHEDAEKVRDEAASHLTPADLSREQERARKWFEDHPAKPR